MYFMMTQMRCDLPIGPVGPCVCTAERWVILCILVESGGFLSEMRVIVTFILSI